MRSQVAANDRNPLKLSFSLVDDPLLVSVGLRSGFVAGANQVHGAVRHDAHIDFRRAPGCTLVPIWSSMKMTYARKLQQARDFADLLKLIQKVRRHLNSMTTQWWMDERSKPSYEPRVLARIDPADEAVWQRRETAKEYRDNLRAQALRLWTPGIPSLPAELDDPERDIFDALTPWVMQQLQEGSTDQIDLPGAINQFLRATSGYLQTRNANHISAAVAQPCAPGSPAKAKMLADIKAAHDREMDAKEAVNATGVTLTKMLVRHGHDATDVLKLLHYICGGGGPDHAYPLWADVKVRLQQLEIASGTVQRTVQGMSASQKKRLLQELAMKRRVLVKRAMERTADGTIYHPDIRAWTSDETNEKTARICNAAAAALMELEQAERALGEELAGDAGDRSNAEASKPGSKHGLTPKQKPTEPSVPVSLARAGKRWFKMDPRTLEDCIRRGTIAAEQLSPKRWRFELEEIRQHNPEALDKADPERQKVSKTKHERA